MCLIFFHYIYFLLFVACVIKALFFYQQKMKTACVACVYCKATAHTKESCFKLQRKMAKISEKAKVMPTTGLLTTPPAPLALAAAVAVAVVPAIDDNDPKITKAAVRRFFGAAHCCYLCRTNQIHDQPTTDADVLATSACGCCFCLRLYLDRLSLVVMPPTQPCTPRYCLTPAQDATLLSELMELQNVNGGRVPVINGLLAPLSETLRYGLACGFYAYKVAGLEMGHYCLPVELASIHNRLPATKDWLAI